MAGQCFTFWARSGLTHENITSIIERFCFLFHALELVLFTSEAQILRIHVKAKKLACSYIWRHL
jgi:hypothetical protein